MDRDPTLAALMSDPNGNMWAGPGGHVVEYPIKNATLYNLVMSQPGKASVGKWNEPGDVHEMRKMHENWDLTLRKIFNNVDRCVKWKLAYIPPLETWVSESGKVVIIGDAAHGMLPYMAQGAAVSIEDAAALAETVSHTQSKDHLPHLLRTFETIRKPRCEEISKGTHINADAWHLSDGPEQEKRDEARKAKMRRTLEKDKQADATSAGGGLGDRWSDEARMPELYGYDAVREMNNFLDGVTSSEVAHL